MSSPKVPRDPQTGKRPGRYVLFAVGVPGGWRPADPHELPDAIEGGARLAGGLTPAKAVQTAAFYNAHAEPGQRIAVVVGPKAVRRLEAGDGHEGTD